MVEHSDDMQDANRAAIYYADLLEVRRVSQKYGLPFWNIVSSNQIRPQTTVPSPANLAFQAYTTLAAGGRGVSWYKYYQDGYAYAPISSRCSRQSTVACCRWIRSWATGFGPDKACLFGWTNSDSSRSGARPTAALKTRVSGSRLSPNQSAEYS